MKLIEILKLIENNAPAAFFYTPVIYNNARSYIFLKPDIVFTAIEKEKINSILDKIDEYVDKGYTGWGIIPYETGYLFDRKLMHLYDNSSCNVKLFQFFFYKNKNVIELDSSDINVESDKISRLLSNYELKNFKINVSKSKYVKDIKKIKQYIEEGDTYQVNYTVKGKFRFSGDINSLFLSLMFNQSSGYSAFINNEDKYLLSFSPELFFETDFNAISTKPMKGTISRGLNKIDDQVKKDLLMCSRKDQAENIMIVDLLRNDLGKISRYDSVKASDLFQIEQYESVFQMISRIDSVLKKKIKLSEIIKNTFPCGSITGAPKLRTMEIIKELEAEPRGIYTGAIGMMNQKPSGKSLMFPVSRFNVAIRTVQIDKNSFKGEIGIGSGIVWDSDPEKEYQEALLKSNFLFKPDSYFELFETLLIENNELFLCEEHIRRLKEAAGYFLFSFSSKKLNKLIKNILKETDSSKNYKLKLILDKWGNFKYEISEIEEDIKLVNVIVSKFTTNSENKFLYYKTTNRSLYESELHFSKSEGFDEVLFINEKGEITEGSFTNIFIYKSNTWFTPSLKCGLLSGTYREFFLKKNAHCKETILYLPDLLEADKIILTNSVRKEIFVKNLFLNKNEYISYV